MSDFAVQTLAQTAMGMTWIIAITAVFIAAIKSANKK